MDAGFKPVKDRVKEHVAGESLARLKVGQWNRYRNGASHICRRSEGSTLGSITDSISYVISTFRSLYQIMIDHTLEFGQN